MVKDLIKYKEKYGEIPKDTIERVHQQISSMRPKEFQTLQERVLQILCIPKRRLHILFYMLPKSSPRPRASFKKTTAKFYVGDAEFNSRIFQEFLSHETRILNIIKTPCKLRMDIYVPTPSLNRIDRCLAELRLLPVVSRPDVDNIAKTYMDMIQKHLLLDDSLVNDLHVRKFYSMKPRIDLRIEYLETYTSDYNRKKIESWNRKDVT